MARKKNARTPSTGSGKSGTSKKVTSRRASSKREMRQAKAAPGKETAPSEPAAPIKQEASFPIVGIGASAGGLEASEVFFKEMPPDAGVAFVLVVHLDPTHASILPALLQKHTEMPVGQATDGVKVEPNHVYVIPPNKDLKIMNGRLLLMEPTQPRGVRLPIDSFFRSLAQDQGRNAVCIILSGTGSDGTLGVKAVKGEVGMVMVQDEESAKYEGMPRSAIGTGLADYVMPPDKMPAQLIKYVSHATQTAAPWIRPDESPVPAALQKVFAVLRASTDHDFSHYKKNTICRRIERRMNVHQIDDLGQYVRYLQDSDREVSILYKELLIGVTNFFRNPEAFDTLRDVILPKLLADKPNEYAVRVWVPGCASGEEAYSAAIVLHECMEQMGRHFHVQVFGTDIDEDAVDVARRAVYPESITVDVEPERLKRYFSKEEDGRFRVRKMIRELLVFAPHDLIKDPPFTKLDLLCCRNLLIYIDGELQRKLLPVFHYSLKSDGILFLGSSETIGAATDLFATVSRKWKIFRRKPTAKSVQPVLDFPAPPDTHAARELAVPETVQRAEELSALQLVETILRQSDMPPCAIVNDAANVVYIHGRTGKFLELAEGKASVNIVELARHGLKAELAAGIRQVATQAEEVVIRDLSVDHNGGQANVTMTIRPILDQSSMHGLMMVLFEETAPDKKAAKRKPKRAVVRRKTKSDEDLVKELQYTKETLQTTIEELETSNEELKSTNEELQSTNEELQSTNEELETSKEELQSLNEEAATVNAELQARIDELSKANDDMKNLLDSTEIATIFLDSHLRVRRFTPRATEIVPLEASDVGRPIAHLVSKLPCLDIAKCGERILDDLTLQKHEVASSDGRHYLARLRPYRTVANVIDGVVVTFEDVTELVHAQAESRLAIVVRDSNDAVTLQDGDGRIIAWNRGAVTMYGYSENEALNMNVAEIVPENKRSEALGLLKRVLNGQEVNQTRTERITKDGHRLSIDLTLTLVRDDQSNTSYIATTERDVTGTEHSPSRTG